MVGQIDADDDPPVPDPPDHLSRMAADVWRQLTEVWVFGPGELVLLEEGLASWDRVRRCRRILDSEGVVVTNPESGHKKHHPAATEADKSLKQVRQVFKQLELEPPQVEDQA